MSDAEEVIAVKTKIKEEIEDMDEEEIGEWVEGQRGNEHWVMTTPARC